MRPLASIVGLALVAVAPACAPPPVAPLSHVTEPHALRVSYRPQRGTLIDFRGRPSTQSEIKTAFYGAEDALEQFNRALADTLQRAGYEVTENGRHDVRVIPELFYSIESRQSRHGSFGSSDLVRVVFHVCAPDGAEIDRFELRSNDDASHLGSAESVAVDLVNAMVRSPKVGSYAEARTTAAATEAHD